MSEDIKKVLKKQVENIKLGKKEEDKIKKIAKEFCLDLSKKLKKIDAELFIGGSLAKNTLVRTDDNKYDVDIFIRFKSNKSKKKDISKELGKILKNAKKVHGSRDYYHITKENIILEIIPVMKIKKPEEAENVTDLSYFHVRYVLDKLKKKKT